MGCCGSSIVENPRKKGGDIKDPIVFTDGKFLICDETRTLRQVEELELSVKALDDYYIKECYLIKELYESISDHSRVLMGSVDSYQKEVTTSIKFSARGWEVTIGERSAFPLLEKLTIEEIFFPNVDEKKKLVDVLDWVHKKKDTEYVEPHINNVGGEVFKFIKE